MKLYIYQHCPYCTKARSIFSLKKIDVDIITLLNDDVNTPTSLIGKKMVPILQVNKNFFLPESDDIIRYIDKIDNSPIFSSYKCNQKIISLIDKYKKYIYQLSMPRWYLSDFPEFSSKSSKEYFKNKKELSVGKFDILIQKTPEILLHIDLFFKEVENILSFSSYLNEKKIQIEDITLFSFIHCLSIVKDISYPPLLDQYRKKLAILFNIDLNDKISI